MPLADEGIQPVEGSQNTAVSLEDRVSTQVCCPTASEPKHTQAFRPYPNSKPANSNAFSAYVNATVLTGDMNCEQGQ